MTTYTMTCQLVFNAEVEVEADSVAEAEDIINNSFSATIGNVSDGCDDRIIDWDIDHCGYPEYIAVK